ncbi:MAG: ubiquinol-cytochrome c reductase iron-sulfur subunit [bacterium]|nr:ubiquinol-cytochrome c reductase iron-sulfur subunit [bacterium]
MSDRLAPDPVPRRDFLGIGGLWAAGLAVFGSLLGMVRLAKPSVLPEAGARFRIGRPDEFPPGTARVIVERNVRIVAEQNGVAAVSLICTHLGCIVSKADTGYSCPCHGSKFDSIGEVVGGPAPRGLRWLEVSLAADGNLVVDAKREVPAGTFYGV